MKTTAYNSSTDISNILETQIYHEYCYSCGESPRKKLNPLVEFMITSNGCGKIYELKHKKLTSVDKLTKTTSYVEYNVGDVRLILVISRDIRGVILDDFYMSGDHSCDDIVDKITASYVQTLNLKECILTISTKDGVNTIKKSKIDSYKHKDLLQTITTIKTKISNNERYGFMLTGIPGTGKTTFINDICAEIETPIVILSHEVLTHMEEFPKILVMLNTIGPCLIILEDFDSNGLDDKKVLYGELLTLLDSNLQEVKHVFMASLNNPKEIRESMLRVGRFDKLINFTPPTDTKEVNCIVTYSSGAKVYDKTTKLLMRNKLTQAEISEISKRCKSVDDLTYNNFKLQTKSFKKERKLLTKGN
jgi:hypothetical protein